MALYTKGDNVRALPDLERAARLSSGADRDQIQLEGVALVRAELGNHQGAAAVVETVVKAGTRDGALLKAGAQVYSRCTHVVRRAAQLSAGQREQLGKGYARRAVALLRRARAAGAFQKGAAVKELRSDPNFADLRMDPDFQAFLQELDKKGGG
jgi:hypothetical protein